MRRDPAKILEANLSLRGKHLTGPRPMVEG